MRDLDRLPIDDDAYSAPSPAGMPPDFDVDDDPETPDAPLFEDDSFTDTVAYGMPSLGGEFGPGRVPVLSGPDDGGEADLAAGATYTAPPALVIPTPPSALPGRSMNATFRTNLFPWFATPPAGLSSNRSSTPPAADPPPPPPPPPPPLPPPFEVNGPTLSNEIATLSISGTSTRNATVHATYVLNDVHYDVHASITSGMTASQIAAAVRTALRANSLLSVTGTGGSVIATPANDADELTAFTVHLDD